MSTYPNAYAKVKKLISDVQFPGNRFELGIIGNDFSSSTIWAIQIPVPYSSKILKISEFNLIIGNRMNHMLFSARINKLTTLRVAWYYS